MTVRIERGLERIEESEASSLEIEELVYLKGRPRFVSEAAENIPKEELETMLSRWSPRSRRRIIETLIMWLEEMRDASRKGVSLLYIFSGEWGVGKTTFRMITLPRYAEKYNFKYKGVRFEDFIAEVKKESIKEADYRKSFENVLRSYVKSVGATPESPLLLLIDEVEGIIGLYNRKEKICDVLAYHAFVGMLRELVSRESTFAQDLKGKIHLVLFVTPHALNFINRTLSEEGYGGWLIRRENVCSIYLLDKLETIEFAKKFIEYICGLPVENIIKDYRILELLYILTCGNTGILIKVIREIFYVLYSKYKRKYHVECIPKLDAKSLLDALTVIKIPKGFETNVSPLNYDRVQRILSTADKNIRPVLLTLIGTSSIINFEEIDYTTYYIIRHISRDMDVIQFRIYLFKDKGEVSEFIDDLAQKLKEDNKDMEIELLRIAASCLVHITKDGNYTVAIPFDEEYKEINMDELKKIMSSYTYIDLSDKVVSFLKDKLKEKEFMKGVGLSSNSKSILYPPYSPVVIPFITNVNDARMIYSQIMEFLRDRPEGLERRAFASIVDMLNAQKLITLKGSKCFLRNPANVELKIIVSIGGYDVNKLYSDETSCVLLIIPQELESVSKLPWNIFPCHMAHSHIMLLAARTLAYDLYRHSLDEAKLEEFYSFIVNRYNIKEIFNKWRERALEQGVYVPEKLGFENTPTLLGVKTRPYIAFRDYYETLLVGGSEIERDLLKDLLHRLYLIRPFRDFAEFITLYDIEPENPVHSDKKKMLQRVQDIVDKTLSISSIIGMAKVKGNTIHLTMHPIEGRILEKLSIVGHLSYKELENYFVFESEAARKVFKELILRVLERRGYIVIEKEKKCRGEIVRLVRLSPDKYYGLLKEVEEYINHLKEALSEKNIDIASPVCHVLISKTKGSKLIFLSDIVTTILKYMEIAGKREDNAVYFTLKILKNYIETIAEEYILKAVHELDKVMDEIEFKTKNLIKDIENLKSMLRKVFGDEAYEKHIESILKRKRKDIELNKERVLEFIVRLRDVSRDELMRRIVVREKNLRGIFRYDLSEVPPHYYNYTLYEAYIVKEAFDKEVAEISSIISDIQEKLSKILSELRRHKVEGYSIILSELEKYKLDSIEKLSDFVNKLAINIDILIENIKRRKNKLKSLGEAVRKFNIKVSEYEEEAIKLEERYSKLVYAARLLDLVEVERAANEVISVIEYVKGRYIPGVRESLNNLDHELSRIQAIGGEIERDIEKLEKLASDIEDMLDIIEKQLKNNSQKVKELEQKILDELSKKLLLISEDLKQKTKVLLKVKASVNLIDRIGKLQDKTNRIRNIAISSLDKAAGEYVKLQGEYQSIKEEIREYLSRKLGEDLYTIYMLTQDKLGKRLYEIVDYLREKTGKSEQEILRALLDFDRKDLIKIEAF